MRKLFSLVAVLSLVCGSVVAQEEAVVQPSASDAATTTAQTVVEPTAAPSVVYQDAQAPVEPVQGMYYEGAQMAGSGCGCAAPVMNDCCNTGRTRVMFNGRRNNNSCCNNNCCTPAPVNNCGCAAPAPVSCGCAAPVANDCCDSGRTRLLFKGRRNNNSNCCAPAPVNNCGCAAPVSCGCATPVAVPSCNSCNNTPVDTCNTASTRNVRVRGLLTRARGRGC